MESKYIVSARATDNPYDDESLSKSVLAIDPNQGCCPVEKTSDDTILHHVVPRECMNNDDFMDRLDWALKKRRGELNLDTPHNVLPVSRSLKEKLDSKEWFILPELEMVLAFADAALGFDGPGERRDLLPDIDQEVFDYILFPVSLGTGDGEMKPLDINSLPKFQSHIRPEFVIAAAGHEMVIKTKSPLAKIRFEFEILREIGFTFQVAWCPPIDGKGDSVESYAPDISISTFPPDKHLGRLFVENPDYLEPIYEYASCSDDYLSFDENEPEPPNAPRIRYICGVTYRKKDHGGGTNSKQLIENNSVGHDD